VRGYSKGMRQRTKLAQALVHDPDVLFLDEPLTGTDPVARRDMMDIIHRLAAQGRSVLVSSHAPHEVESLTQNVVLLNRGRLVAEGHVRDVRDLIDKHPLHIVLVGDEYRKFAGRVLVLEDVEGVIDMAAEAWQLPVREDPLLLEHPSLRTCLLVLLAVSAVSTALGAYRCSRREFHVKTPEGELRTAGPSRVELHLFDWPHDATHFKRPLQSLPAGSTSVPRPRRAAPSGPRLRCAGGAPRRHRSIPGAGH
jgi:hypothetical protein